MSAQLNIDAPYPVQQTLADLCQGVAGELDDLGDRVDQLQPAISALVTTGQGAVDAAHYEKLQALDYISQHLKGLSQFLKVLSREAPALAAVEAGRALAGLTLSDLHDRLSACDFSAYVEPDDDDPSWEMF